MRAKNSKIIGITGGIATGKSMVSRYLKEKYSLPIFDADIFARDAVRVNSPIFSSVVDRYGKEILLSDGSLNRYQLGKIIFSNSQEKKWLESQIHPFVYQCFHRAIASVNQPLIIFVIPLLFEANMTDLVDEVWVISCDFSQQLKRLQERNKLTEEEAILMINSQMPLREKISLADKVINNSYGLTELYDQIDEILQLTGLISPLKIID